MPTMLRPREAQKVLDKINHTKTKVGKNNDQDRTFTKVSDARPNPRTAGYVR